MGTDLTLLDLLDRTPAPVHRHDPDTSRIAAARVDKSATRRKVLMALYRKGEVGGTSEELGTATGLSATSAGTRVGELRKVGLAWTSDRCRDTFAGNPAHIHFLTAEGRVLAASLAKSW